jgi:MazG family protein
VPRSLPALVEAQKIAGRAAGAGFDWANIEQVFDKLREELAELDAARAASNQEGSKQDEIEDELGDLLFVVVNIARFLKVDPEQALRKTNAKFRNRFAHVEAGVEASGKTLPEAGIEEMERLWQQAKRLSQDAKRARKEEIGKEA